MSGYINSEPGFKKQNSYNFTGSSTLGNETRIRDAQGNWHTLKPGVSVRDYRAEQNQRQADEAQRVANQNQGYAGSLDSPKGGGGSASPGAYSAFRVTPLVPNHPGDAAQAAQTNDFFGQVVEFGKRMINAGHSENKAYSKMKEMWLGTFAPKGYYRSRIDTLRPFDPGVGVLSGYNPSSQNGAGGLQPPNFIVDPARSAGGGSSYGDVFEAASSGATGGDVLGRARDQYDATDTQNQGLIGSFLGQSGPGGSSPDFMSGIRSEAGNLRGLSGSGLSLFGPGGDINTERSNSFWADLDAYKDLDSGGAGSGTAQRRSLASNVILGAFNDAGLDRAEMTNSQLGYAQLASKALQSNNVERRNEGVLMLQGLVGSLGGQGSAAPQASGEGLQTQIATAAPTAQSASAGGSTEDFFGETDAT